MLRGTLAVSLVWLLAPHEPDLGMAAKPAARACLAARPCGDGAGEAGAWRQAIFARLNEVQRELQNSR